jgi:hypothetical protein
MNNNFYWTVYKNLESELIDLSNSIHIDDKQLEVYSIKIAELILRTVVEIESLSKTLYFENGGEKSYDNNLFFDTDCLDLLEKKWLLSKKHVVVTAPNFYLTKNENKILTPLQKANKRGTSSSDWQKAFQAIKHDRVTSLPKANLKHLIRSLAALFVLNVFNNDIIINLNTDSEGTNFDNSLGSSVFSIKLHKHNGIHKYEEYSKRVDFDECLYLLKPTNETKDAVQQIIDEINDKINESTKTILIEQLSTQLSEIISNNTEEVNEKVRTIAEKIKLENMMKITKENGKRLSKTFDNLRYEAVLNKQQY